VRYGAFRSGVDLFDVHTKDALRRIISAHLDAISTSIEKDILTATKEAGRKIMVK
jgi:hypothetical protein